MTSTAKSSITANTAGLVDGSSADASDVLNPITDLLNHAKSGRVAVTAADANVKHLNDALTVGSGLAKSTVNGGADEALNLAIDAAVVATLTGTQTLTNKTLTTPTIGSFANANHDHSNAAGGGGLPGTSITSGTVPVARLPVMVGDAGAGGTAGLVPAPSAGDAAAGKFLGAGGTWAFPGDFVKIASDVLSSDAASISITSIPSTYTHLWLRMGLRSNNTAADLRIRLNNNTTGNYYDYSNWGGSAEEGLGIIGYNADDENFFEAQAALPTLATDTLALMDFHFYRYSTSGTKFVRGDCMIIHIDSTSEIFGSYSSFVRARWREGSAINRIDLYPNSAVSIESGSWYQLYGMK